jgi:cytochrome c oxidase subunit 3
MNKNKLMMIIFVGSEAFFFLALIISYVYYSYSGGRVESRAEYLDVGRTAIFTFFLFSSSLTVELAGRQLRAGNRKTMLALLLTTIVFGLIFLVGQGTEYARLIGLDITISKNVFGSAFFTLTGFHGLHVLIGLIVLSVFSSVVYSGKFRKVEAIGFEPVSIYWHFVDAVWVAVFSVVYLGAIL